MTVESWSHLKSMGVLSIQQTYDVTSEVTVLDNGSKYF